MSLFATQKQDEKDWRVSERYVKCVLAEKADWTVEHDKAHTYSYDMLKLFRLGFMFLLRPSVQQVMEYLGYVSGSTNQKTVLWSAFSENISDQSW